jgi:hypothetical protein
MMLFSNKDRTFVFGNVRFSDDMNSITITVMGRVNLISWGT